MAELRIVGLPGDALAAAAQFHAEWLAKIAPHGAGEDLVLVFAPADHTHRGWRLAAVQSLARQFAPVRINAVVSDDEAAIHAAVRYLNEAGGVTGQYFTLDGVGAGEVIGSAP